MVDLILKKRDGFELTHAEISEVIHGFLSGEIPDYQMSALLMAIFFKGMTTNETSQLTDAMMCSGELMDLSDIPGIKVDKHSTGGVGDKTTLILAPLVAAAGVPVAKMSGRGLGHTGGTLDKMESISGLSVDMNKEDFIAQVKKCNIAICGQNDKLVPADKKLYALRDVTGTVSSMPLIASSIMSKKLACGADTIVIDIKLGSGAFMKTLEDAEKLANTVIGIGAKMNRKVVAVISEMNEPLGNAIGNALEVKEAIDTLRHKGPKDLTELCLVLGSEMLVLGKIAKTKEEAIIKLENLIASGAAFNKFQELVTAQGGDLTMVLNPNLLPTSTHSKIYRSKTAGYIYELKALEVGLASTKLGAGRETKDSQIDFGAGIVLNKKIGDYVKNGESLATLYANDSASFKKAEVLLDKAYSFKNYKPDKKLLILKTMT